VPVLGPNGLAYGAIEVEVDAVTPETVATVAPALRLAAEALNRELGPGRDRGPGASHGMLAVDELEPAAQ
jgi:hypothetical protein